MGFYLNKVFSCFCVSIGRKMKIDLFVPTLISFMFFEVAFSCMCTDEHVQQKYCKNPIAAKVIVLEKKTFHENLQYDENLRLNYYPPSNDRVEIKVRTISLYKGDQNLERIITTTSDGLCGISDKFQVGHYYMLTARYRNDEVWVGSCEYLFDITHVSFLESKLLSENFQRNWQKGCQCDFKRGGESVIPSETIGHCEWDETDNYNQNFSYCFPDKKQICRSWKYDVGALKNQSSGKTKYKKSRSSRKILN